MRELERVTPQVYVLASIMMLLMIIYAQPVFASGAKPNEVNGTDLGTSETIPVAGVVTVADLPAPVAGGGHAAVSIPARNLATGSAQTTGAQEPLANIVSPQSIAVSTAFTGLAYNQNPFGLTPPDGALGAGPLNVFEMVNVIGQVYSRTGATIGTTFTMNSFFSISSTAFTSDPKVLYDALSGRFFASELSCSDSSCSAFSTKFVDLAVSKTNDAAGAFCIYHIRYGTTLPDQPILGLGSDKLIVSANAFALGSAFVGAHFVVLKLSDLTGCKAAHAKAFGPYSSTTSIHPVQAQSPTTTEYMVSTAAGLAGTVKLYAVTGVPGTTVTVKVTSFKVSPIANPPAAPQKGSIYKLDTGDVRVEDAVFSNNRIWFVFNNQCTPQGDTMARSCLHFVQFNTATMKVAQDFNLGAVGKYYLYGALRVDSGGDLMVVFSSSSTSDFPGVMVTEQSATDPAGTLEAPLVLKAGAGPVQLTFGCGASAGLPSNVCRFGDFNAASTDPTSPKTVWVESELGDGTTDPTYGGEWGTEVGIITG